MTFPTEQEHYDAVVAALDALSANPYGYEDTVPSSVSGYTLPAVSDRVGGALRLTGQVGIRAVRVTCRYVGRTPDNVREMRKRGEAALREQSITVAGYESTPIQFETAEQVAPDGDLERSGQWYSALSAYTYSV